MLSSLNLTNQNDLQHHGVSPYYPQRVGEEVIYNEYMKIECWAIRNVTSNLLSYKLLMTDLFTKKSQEIDLLNYTGWLDECGTNEKELLNLIKNIEPYLSQSHRLPVVHCMGGVGRTGTFMTSAALKIFNDRENFKDYFTFENQMEIFILEGRRQRGPEFVRTDTQIKTICNLYNFLVCKVS